jgi:hypothetical protein
MTPRILVVLVAVVGGACASEPTTPWKSPSETLSITRCTGATAGDPYSLGQVSLDGNDLIAHVTTGGGCRSHRFATCWNGRVFDSQPPQVGVELSHDAGGDTCDALLSYDLRIDLTGLVDEVRPPVIVRVVGAQAQIAGTTDTVRVDP